MSIMALALSALVVCPHFALIAQQARRVPSGVRLITREVSLGKPHPGEIQYSRVVSNDDKHIAYEITINDPKIFTKPWKNVRTLTLRPDWEILEYSCEENNKDFIEGHIK